MEERTSEPRRVLTPDEIDALIVEADKGQQLAGHFPDADALGRARRLLEGKISLEEGRAEIYAKYAPGFVKMTNPQPQTTANREEPPRAHDEVERLMAIVEKSQQLAGHFPDAEALDRARRILTGETTLEVALAEIDAQYSADG